MKRRHSLIPFAKASTVIAMPLISLVAITYASRVVTQSATELYPVCMAAFGVTAALAGICLTIPPGDNGLTQTRYGGEKFLHSALLLIQTLMIVYLKDGLRISAWWNGHRTLSSLALGTFTVLLGLLSGAAAFAWFFGFEALNDELWSNWDRRLRRLTEAEESKRAASTKKEK